MLVIKPTVKTKYKNKVDDFAFAKFERMELDIKNAPAKANTIDAKIPRIVTISILWLSILVFNLLCATLTFLISDCKESTFF